MMLPASVHVGQLLDCSVDAVLL